MPSLNFDRVCCLFFACVFATGVAVAEDPDTRAQGNAGEQQLPDQFRTYEGTLVVKKRDGAPATSEWVRILTPGGTQARTGLTDRTYGDLSLDSFSKPLAPGHYILEWDGLRATLIWDGSNARLQPYDAKQMETLQQEIDKMSQKKDVGTVRILAAPQIVGGSPVEPPPDQVPQPPPDTAPSFEFKEAVLELDVKPTITADGSIQLDLSIKPSSELVFPSGTLVSGEARQLQTSVTQLPGLSKIPLLGYLLRQPTKPDAPSEILFLKLPQLDDKDNKAAQSPTGSQKQQAPGDMPADAKEQPSAPPSVGMWHMDAGIGAGIVWFADLKRNVEQGVADAIASGMVTNVRSSTEDNVPVLDLDLGLSRKVGGGAVRVGVFIMDAQTVKGQFSGDFIDSTDSFLITGESDMKMYGVDLSWLQPLSQDAKLKGQAGVGYIVLDQSDISTSYVVNSAGERSMVSRNRESDSDSALYWRLGLFWEFLSHKNSFGDGSASIGANYQRTFGGIGPNDEHLSAATVNVSYEVQLQ